MATQYNKNPEIGDLIQIHNPISVGSFYHWAVYVGDDSVVHLVPPFCGGSSSSSGSSSTNALVKMEKLTVVVGTKEWKINNILENKLKPRPADVIVRNACALVGKWQPYSLIGRNCEHFATELRYGKAGSQQVWAGGMVTWVSGGVLLIAGLITTAPVTAVVGAGLYVYGLVLALKNKLCS